VNKWLTQSVTVRHPPNYRSDKALPFLVAKLVTTGALVIANALGRNVAIPSKWRSERITAYSEVTSVLVGSGPRSGSDNDNYRASLCAARSSSGRIPGRLAAAARDSGKTL